LKKLNEEISTLSTDFSTKLLAATKDGAYVTADKSALAGMTDAQIAAAAQAAQSRKQEGYVLPLQNTTQQPDLASLTVRATRKPSLRNPGTAPSEAMPTIHATTLRAWHSSVRAEHSSSYPTTPLGSWETRWRKHLSCLEVHGRACAGRHRQSS